MSRLPDRSAVMPHADALSRIGRVGCLSLEYARQSRHTTLTRSYCTSPWHFFPPSHPDSSGYAYSLVVNPSGGLVGGDDLSMSLSLGEATHVLASTPSANRVYRSNGKTARQQVRLQLGPRAVLEWLPDLIIPFAGSRYRQHTDVMLEAGATILFWDAMASGRIASGERWTFASFENELRITTAAGASIIERYHLAPQESSSGIGIAGEWNYVATLLLVGELIHPGVLKRVRDQWDQIMDEPHDAMGGVSVPAAPGLVVKLLARTSSSLQDLFDLLWSAARREVWGLTRADLRRY